MSFWVEVGSSVSAKTRGPRISMKPTTQVESSHTKEKPGFLWFEAPGDGRKRGKTLKNICSFGTQWRRICSAAWNSQNKVRQTVTGRSRLGACHLSRRSPVESDSSKCLIFSLTKLGNSSFHWMCLKEKQEINGNQGFMFTLETRNMGCLVNHDHWLTTWVSERWEWPR